MNKKIAVYFMFCFCLFCEGIFAQVKENDSTTSIYQDIHDLSKKSKFNKFVYKLLFRSSALKAENLINILDQTELIEFDNISFKRDLKYM